MIERLFPRQLNNDYLGSPIAKWVFVVLTFVTIVRSLIHMFAPDGGAQSIATIPLDGFTPEGASAVILIFALWGLSQLLIGVIYGVVLWRYQAFIPFMYLLLIVEYVMRMVLGMMKPITTTGTAPGGVGNYVIVPLAVVMLWLSLRRRE
ncbi:hypothetical protein ACFLYO_07440 [Chloroflexota bacterium]